MPLPHVFDTVDPYTLVHWTVMDLPDTVMEKLPFRNDVRWSDSKTDLNVCTSAQPGIRTACKLDRDGPECFYIRDVTAVV